MKQKKCYMGLIIVLIAVVLGSCKGSVGVPVLGNKPKVLKPGEIPIKVTISDENFPSYRTIVPGGWSAAEKGNLTFKLFNVTSLPEVQLGSDWSWNDIQQEGTAKNPPPCQFLAWSLPKGKLRYVKFSRRTRRHYPL